MDIQLEQKKIHNRRLSKKANPLIKFLAWVSFLALVASAIYLFIFSPLAGISKVNVVGAQTIDQDMIRQAVEQEISGRYFDRVNKNNFLIYPKKSIEQKVLERFRQIKQLEIKIKFPDTLNVLISERVSRLVLCEKENCFAVDKEGIAFAKIGQEGIVLNIESLPKLINEKGRDLNIYSEVIEPAYAEYVYNLPRKLMESMGIEISNEIKTPQLVSGDLKAKTSAGWEIYFNNSIDLDKEIEMLRTVLESKIPKEEMPNLEYIDLRLDNKVYYKLKNTEPIEEKTPEVPKEPEKDKKENSKKKKG